VPDAFARTSRRASCAAPVASGPRLHAHRLSPQSLSGLDSPPNHLATRGPLPASGPPTDRTPFSAAALPFPSLLPPDKCHSMAPSSSTFTHGEPQCSQRAGKIPLLSRLPLLLHYRPEASPCQSSPSVLCLARHTLPVELTLGVGGRG
jgi:hypothetical protein